MIPLLLTLAAIAMPVETHSQRVTKQCRDSDVHCAAWHVFGRRAPAALRVSWCESRWNARAVSPTNDYGAWQINRYYHRWAFTEGDIFDATWNARVAYHLSNGGRTWRAWTCGWAA